MSLINERTSARNSLQFHPLADIFPLMEGAEFDELVADIKKRGQQARIVLKDGMILDGRNRYRACLAAGIEPMFACQAYSDRITDPVAFVVAANIRRRHLKPEDKIKILAQLVAAKPERSDRRLAKETGVSHPTIAKARRAAEATGKALPVDKRTGADGKARRRPATKRAKPKSEATSKITAPTKATSPPARARQDIGPASTAEVERLCARLDGLQAEKRQLEIKIAGLESEVEELKAENTELRKKLEAVGALSDAEEVERDRKACIALFQKVTDSERELAEWEAAHPKNAPAAASEPNPEPKPGSPAKKRRGWSRERYKAFRARKRGRKNRSKLDPGDPGGSATPAAAKPKANGKGKSTSGGNNIDAQASTEARKAEFAALEAASDPGPIPDVRAARNGAS
jgi:hypothetical protein